MRRWQLVMFFSALFILAGAFLGGGSAELHAAPVLAGALVGVGTAAGLAAMLVMLIVLNQPAAFWNEELFTDPDDPPAGPKSRDPEI